MSNVVAKRLVDYVLLLPLDSINAFYAAKHFGLRPGAIHTDAGHKHESVSQDIKTWWTLLREGGVMVCDDYLLDDDGNPAGWTEVARAVDRHLKRTDAAINFRHESKMCWLEKRGHGDPGRAG